MDFRDWKKTKEDGKTCTLCHPKGHKMTIALNALSKIQREQIKRLKLADGGEVDGTDQSDSGQPPAGNHTPITINVGALSPSSSTSPGANMAPAQASRPPQPAQAPPAQPQGPGSGPNLMLPDQTINAPAAVGLQQKAIEQEAPIQAEMARKQADYEQSYLQDRAAIAQRDQDHYNELKQHTDDFRDYMNKNPINPKAYQESMGAGEKTATGIGLFLGGFGTPFGGHNYAQDFLNKQIDRDIDAQKTRADQQKTVWGAYRDLYGDSNIATNLAKVSLNDMLVHSTNLAAAQLGTPQAIQKANEMKAQKAIENNQLLIDSSGRLGTLRTGDGLPGAQPSHAPNGIQPETHNQTGQAHPLQGSLLTPASNHQFEGVKYKLKALGREGDLPELTRQFTQAQQADKALGAVNDTFLNLWKNANESGISGRVRRTLNPHAIAAAGAGMGAAFGPVGIGIGAAGGEGLGHAILQATNTDKNRLYDSSQSELKGYISAALKGTNIGSGDIDDIVDKNSPEYGDSEKSAAMKLKTIRDFIKNHTETSLLKTYGLTKE